MFVKLIIMVFVYVSAILDCGESSYSGEGGYHDEMRRLALVKATHIIRNGVSPPQSHSTPPAVCFLASFSLIIKKEKQSLLAIWYTIDETK